VALAGCNIIADTHRVFFLAKRTTKLEPRYFPYLRNERLSRMRNYALARRVWSEVSEDRPEAYSKHYAKGFVSGFTDYMFRGGTGSPPLIPPRAYWQMGYETPGGKQAIHDWYAGFQHGAEECKLRGHRDLVVVPSSLVQRATAHADALLPEDFQHRDESLERLPAPAGPEPSDLESLESPEEPGPETTRSLLPAAGDQSRAAVPPAEPAHPYEYEYDAGDVQRLGGTTPQAGMPPPEAMPVIRPVDQPPGEAWSPPRPEPDAVPGQDGSFPTETVPTRNPVPGHPTEPSDPTVPVVRPARRYPDPPREAVATRPDGRLQLVTGLSEDARGRSQAPPMPDSEPASPRSTVPQPSSGRAAQPSLYWNWTPAGP
jgi:hypothetical protein